MYEQQTDCQLGKEPIQVVTGIFLWPDPKKIQALTHMKFSPDKETMRSFLSMINYLNRYSALSADLAAPISALTHKATDYKPGKVHFENFN